MPGVEKRANAIATLLDQKPIETTSKITNLMVILFSGILFTLLIAELKAIGSIGILVPFIFLISYSGYYLFLEVRIWLNVTYPSFNIIGIFITVNVLNYLRQERESKTIKSIFSSYVTEKVVEELIKDSGSSKIGFKRRETTILFADLKGFTPFAEKYPPEEVFSLLNEYLKTMTDTVFKWNGTLNKFIGDTVVAFWGAPTEQSDHAELAIKCALNMVKKFEGLQQKWRAEGKPEIGISIGINTGEVLVGNIGSEGKKIEYSIIGDNVNLCARIESLTRKYNAVILITEFTMNKIRDSIERHIISHIAIKGIENVRVKGREKSVKLYEVKTLEHGIESVIV